MKIADKIFTICQGDLAINPAFYSSLLQMSTHPNEKIANAAQALWQCLQVKIFPNYPLKGKRKLIEWLTESMSSMTDRHNEEEPPMLAVILDIITQIVSPKKEEGVPNLKLKNAPIVESILLINPLMYWMDFASRTEEKCALFLVVFNCIVTIYQQFKGFEELNVNSLCMPVIKKINEMLEKSCPNANVLKAIESILCSVQVYK
jgi:hypothetical protein